MALGSSTFQFAAGAVDDLFSIGGLEAKAAGNRVQAEQYDLARAGALRNEQFTKTSYEIMEIFGQIHRSGNTVVLVTHEEDIAKHAHRVVRLRDGLVETDKRGAPTMVTG